MANIDIIKSNANLVKNETETGENTAARVGGVLVDIADYIGDGYMFAGIATPSTNPGAPDGPVFYFATQPGTYSNFGGLSVDDGKVAVLKYNGSAWSKDTTGLASEKKITELSRQTTFGISRNSYIKYNTKTKIIILPAGNFITNGQNAREFRGATIDVTDKLSNGACLLYAVMSDTTDVIAIRWRGHFEEVPDNYAMIGYIYNNNVHINGVSDLNIRIYDDDNNQHVIRGITDKQNNYPDSLMNQVGMKNNTAKFSFLGYSGGKITYDTTTKILTLPAGGIVTNGNKTSAFSGIELNLSEVETTDNCWIIFVSYTNTNNVKAVGWGKVVEEGENLSDYCMIGYVFNSSVNIIGVNPTDIIVNGTISNQKIAVINCCNDKTFIEYDRENKVLKQHVGGYWSFLNESKSNTIEQTLQLNEGYYAEAYQLFVDKTGNISAKKWTYIGQYNEYYIGYIYIGNISIFGLNPRNLLLKINTCYFFGDSITAGVGCTTPYHVHLSKWLDIKSLNYGIGSTGFVVTTTNNVEVGNGVEGKGGSQKESGDNTFLRTMQKNNDFKYCSIWGGTNDFGAGVELTTFKSAVEETLDYALSITPCVVCATPIKRRTPETNSKGYTLKQYCDIIMAACEERGIPCFDGYNCLGLYPKNDTNNSTFYADGLHTKDKGQKRMALGYKNYVETLFV